jgi:pantoate--beta-alanine ligase
MSNSPQIFTTIAEITDWRRKARGQIGFVPTMGALHEGHATLLRQIRSRCDTSVLSIFVNPTQFGPKEDLSKYPKTFERDLEIAAREGVDFVFAPSPTEMYPFGYSTFVEETSRSLPLCGKVRPGHFRGVTTIVLKLFNLIRPDLALFGLKDAQQFFVLKKMIQDLNLGIRVEGIPTVREKDGLALSSRNAYLSGEEREKAPQLHQALLRIKENLKTHPSGASFTRSLEQTEKDLNAQGFQVQYLECLEIPELKPLKDGDPIDPTRPLCIALAAYLGKTRLIDNIILNEEHLQV